MGNIFMATGENYAFVNVTVKDNSLPETEKTFSVELVNPTGGAELGAGARALVTIEARTAPLASCSSPTLLSM